MGKRLFQKLVISLLAVAMFSPFAYSGQAKQKPNIIMVFIDDMGWADLSCFGNVDAKTPAVDRLAAEGIAFEQFYVNSPICSPSRVAISTGQYPQLTYLLKGIYYGQTDTAGNT